METAAWGVSLPAIWTRRRDLKYPVTGFSIRYEFGIFKQKIVDGWQIEFPDDWLGLGDVWLRTREDDAVEVRFGGTVHEWMDHGKFKAAQVGYQSVMAVPHDLYFGLSRRRSKQADALVGNGAARV